MNSWFVRIHFCFFVYIFQFICVTIDSCILHEERKIKMNNDKEFLATEPIGKAAVKTGNSDFGRSDDQYALQYY